MIRQIIFYILFYIYKLWKIIFYIDKKFLDIIANPNSDDSIGICTLTIKWNLIYDM